MKQNKKIKNIIPEGEFSWAVTGTFHGSIVQSKTEGEARRAFHQKYNGESIVTIKRNDVSAWCF